MLQPMLRSLKASLNDSADDQAELGRARRTPAADRRTLAADARRGRPDFSLDDWAQRRGLSVRGRRPQAGYLSVTCPWSEDVLFNVVRGPFAGGADGVLCHELRLLEGDDQNGTFHGVQPLRKGGWKAVATEVASAGWLGGPGHFNVPYTSAGVRAAHLGTLTGLHVARRSERFTHDQGTTWRGRTVELGDHWVVAVRKHSDQRVVEDLLRGPLGDLLSAPQGLGFEVRIEYGQVVVSRQDFLRRDEDLDALAAAAATLADAVRRICAPRLAPVALDRPLPPPRWLNSVRSHAGEPHVQLPTRARLDLVVAVADERDLVVEDPRAFHTAYPACNVPGEAFAVLRGRLPGTDLTGRLLCCAERPMTLPDDIARLLTNPGGKTGCDVAVLEVAPDTPATAPEGEIEGDLRVAVAAGVLTVWRTRPRWQADGPALDAFAADVAAMVDRRELRVAQCV